MTASPADQLQEALAALEDARRALKPTSRSRLFGVTRRQLDRTYEQERQRIIEYFADRPDRGPESGDEALSSEVQGEALPSATRAGRPDLDPSLEMLLYQAKRDLAAKDFRALQAVFRDWGRSANGLRNNLTDGTNKEDSDLLNQLSASIVMADRAKHDLLTPPTDERALRRIAEPALGQMTRCVGLTRSRLSERAP